MERRIYLDHASTTPMDKEIFEKVAPYYTDFFGNADSPHAVGRKAMSAVDNARDTIAKWINAKANEVYFTSGGTEADNWAILGLARAKRKEGREQVIVSAIEHHAVLFAVETLKKEGFTIVYLPVDEGGEICLESLKKSVNEKTALVAVMSANNETGVLQPVQEAMKIAHAHGALFFTDAVQYAPHARIDVRAWEVDALSFSGHKFYGPKGCGVLYLKSGVGIEKLVGGGEQERGLRGGTVNVPAVVALSEAYAKTVENLAQTEEKLRTLSQLFLRGISILPEVTRNGGEKNALPSILNLRFAGVENTALLYALDLQGICLSAGSACASASVKPSHVLTAMGLREEEVKECVRVSLGKTNTEEEIQEATKKIVETVRRLRGF